MCYVEGACLPTLLLCSSATMTCAALKLKCHTRPGPRACLQNLRRVAQEFVIDLYLRPAVAHFRLMDYHLMASVGGRQRLKKASPVLAAAPELLTVAGMSQGAHSRTPCPQERIVRDASRYAFLAVSEWHSRVGAHLAGPLAAEAAAAAGVGPQGTPWPGHHRGPQRCVGCSTRVPPHRNTGQCAAPL